MAVATVDIQVNSQGAVRNLNQVSAASKATASAVDGVKNAVTGLVGAFTVVSTLKFVFAKTAELETQTRSLQVLTGSVQQAKSIIQELQQLGAVTPFTSTELIDTAKRLNAFGVEGDKVVETTRRLADVAGATGAELQGLATAYGQVQAKGRLQGEELLQFQERGVALQDELRKMYGLTGEEFQKALSKGRISAEAVEVAVKRLTDTGGKYANGAIAQSDTLQGKFSTLTDGVEQLAKTIGVVLTPALKAIFAQAIQVVDAINAALAAGRGGGFARNLAGARASINLGATSEGVDRIAKGIGQVSSQRNKSGIQQNLQALRNYQATLSSIRAEQAQDPRTQEKLLSLQGAIQQKINQNEAAQQQLNKAQAAIFKPAAIPALLGETGGGKKKTGKSDAEKAAETAAKSAAKEAKQAAEEAQKQLDSASKLSDIAAANLDIQVSMNDAERLKGEFDKAAVERRMQYLELQKNAKSQQERELLASAQLSEVLIANNKYAKDKKALLDQQLKPLEDIIAANKTKLEDDKAYQRLVAEGINPELAKQYIEIDRAGKALQEALQPAIDLAKVAVVEAEARGASADEVARLRKELEGLQQLPGQKAEEARKRAEAANQPKTFQEGIAGERDKIKKELDELTKASNLVAFGAKAIGDSFANSFKGIISGSMGAKEALSSFFKGIADAFLDMAAQIIAKWITMTILNSVLSLFPGGGGGGGGKGLDKLPMDDISRYAVPLPGFAEGGYVTGPTNALIGEGGQSEYVIPASKMMQAMSNYSAGKRGASILGDSSTTGDNSMGGSTGAFTLETVVINNIEYATVDQVRTMSNAAAKQGAEGGFSKSMSSLRNSRSQRSRLGMR